MKTNRISIAYADYYRLNRQSICTYLTEIGNIGVTAQADTGDQLINKLKHAEELPQICVIEINIPNKNGYETVKEIKRLWPDMKILILTELDSEFAVVQMLKIGINAYILKTCAIEELVKALGEIHTRGFYDTEISMKYMRKAFSSGKATGRLFISDKEMQFLFYCCYDYHYKEIAQKMSVSTRTVEGYRNGLFEKLNINSRVGLVMMAVKMGIAPFYDHSSIR